MPRYYFDVQDHELTRDNEGMEFTNPSDAAKHAIGALPAIAAHEVPDDQGLRDDLTVLVRDAEGSTIYSATLMLTGTWLTRCASATAQPEWPSQVDSTRH
jgi:hypothetical protein